MRSLNFDFNMIVMIYMKKIFVLTIFAFSFGFAAHAQHLEKSQQTIDYKTYIEMVGKQNLGYASEKLNVSVAEAELKASKVFNDPELSVEYGDNDDKRMQMGRSVAVELSKTFSVGKRGANIDLAKSEKALNEALLEDYFHRLRAEATLAYLESLKQSELYRVKENSSATFAVWQKPTACVSNQAKLRKWTPCKANSKRISHTTTCFRRIPNYAMPILPLDYGRAFSTKTSFTIRPEVCKPKNALSIPNNFCKRLWQTGRIWLPL
ncbi:hypothetical protein AGMMS49965_20310 [Bacteroidia bacterium]|nr:hypothetical protein AGMMS49965_20310 [Bacteroidia bacterium]